MGRCAARLGLALATVLVPTTAHATWSIVGVDPQTQEVGVAVASCVEAPLGTTILRQVAGLAPGVGALAAQALYSQQRRDQALALLTAGATPQEVIDDVVGSDPQSAVRQYGVVTLDGQTATFTGAATQAWAGDLQGPNVTVQGNILYGPEVVADALAAFEAEAPRCPFTLADRLMLALEAGAAQGGDNRCSEQQTALAAALRVARPGDDPEASFLDLRIPSEPQGGANPVQLLRAEYDQWRLRNPPDDSGCMGATGTGTGSADDTTGAAEGTTPGEGTSTTVPPSSSGAPMTAAPPSRNSDNGSVGSTGDDGGCGCRSTSPSPPELLPLGMLAFVARRRRYG